MQASFAKLPLRIINDVAIQPEDNVAAAIPARASVAAKIVLPQHARPVFHPARHRHYKCCSVEVLPAADVSPKQTKRLSFWDQLIMAHQRNLVPARDQ